MEVIMNGQTYWNLFCYQIMFGALKIIDLNEV